MTIWGMGVGEIIVVGVLSTAVVVAILCVIVYALERLDIGTD